MHCHVQVFVVIVCCCLFFLFVFFWGGSDDGNINSYLHLCKVFSLSAEPLPLSLYCLAALGYENFFTCF